MRVSHVAAQSAFQLFDYLYCCSSFMSGASRGRLSSLVERLALKTSACVALCQDLARGSGAQGLPAEDQDREFVEFVELKSCVAILCSGPPVSLDLPGLGAAFAFRFKSRTLHLPFHICCHALRRCFLCLHEHVSLRAWGSLPCDPGGPWP